MAACQADPGELLAFFQPAPRALPLYEALEALLREQFPVLNIRVQKTQITFSSRHVFACVSLPGRKLGNRSDAALLLTFGLAFRLEHPRIAQVVEPYPGRWTHHLLLHEAEELDPQLMDWLQQAYGFSMAK